MARINSDRVKDVLDYEKDIKGKRIISLSAGVCSGKNHAFVELAKAMPDLRLLLITSRKNTVIAQAKKMGAVTFFDFDKHIDNDSVDFPSKNVVCTNASLEKYIKYKYKPNDENTHLWNKFDLIVLDEAHSLTTDATFTDCFYTASFLVHAYNQNPNCDIVLMSGTIYPINWFINKYFENEIHHLNYFDSCVHLEPKNVFIMSKNKVIRYIYGLWEKGERIVYFANFKNSIAEITTTLMNMGVPADSFGYSFNLEDKDINDQENNFTFPPEIESSLKDNIDRMNTALTIHERIPSEIKIFFSTSKNKEGINIEDDDIGITFAETHYRTDLTQIVGRVRGNPDTGTGIQTLVIVADAKQFNRPANVFLSTLNKNCVDAVNVSLKEQKSYCENNNKTFTLNDVIAVLPEEFTDIRYDYFKEEFAWYEGRYEGNRQYLGSLKLFKEVIELYSEPVFLRFINKDDLLFLTGKELLENEWFKWSKVYSFYQGKEESKTNFKHILLDFLASNDLLDNVIDTEAVELIKAEIHCIADMFGYKTLGIDEDFSSLGPVLKKFDLTLKCTSHNTSNKKYLISKVEIGKK